MRHGIPNLGALQAFEATARLGTFSRAAEELALTHSAVFRQVAGLEERLGVPLFTRVRRRVVLTEAGAEYAARVRHHLEQLEKDTFGLMARSGVGRSLHIAVLPTYATAWLIPRLPDFQQRHPDITVSLSSRPQAFQFGDHPFDGAIYHAEQPWARTCSIKLFDEKELVPVCHPALLSDPGLRGSHPAAAAKTGHAVEDGLAPERLRGMTHLHIISRPDAWRAWYRQQGLDYTPGISAGPRYELFSMTLAAVHAGLGVALMPGFMVQEALAAGALVMPTAGGLSVREHYYFGYPAEPGASPALLAFADWLVSAVGRAGP